MTKNQKSNQMRIGHDLIVVTNALKQHFEASLEYIEAIQNNQDVESNLNYILRDNSNLIGQQSSMVTVCLSALNGLYKEMQTEAIPSALKCKKCKSGLWDTYSLITRLCDKCQGRKK